MRIILVVLAMCGSMPASSIPDSLRPSLSFHASFDKGLDADFARGDAKIHRARRDWHGLPQSRETGEHVLQSRKCA